MILIKRITVSGILLLSMLAAGCAYKIEIVQGHEAVLEQLEQLEVGMSKQEVDTLLRGLAVPKLFDDNSYIYTYQKREAGFIDRMRIRSVKLIFDENDTVQEIIVLRDDYAQEEQS